MLRRHFVTLLLFFVLSSCGQGNSARQKESQDAPVESLPRASAQTFWDRFDFTDTVAMTNPDVTEQALVDFIVVLDQTPPAEIGGAIHHMMERAERSSRAVFDHFLQITDKYLYHPNSPMRNEFYYDAVLTYVESADLAEEADRVRAKRLSSLIRKNQPGEVANSFTFETPSGQVQRLEDLRSPYTLLFFYEPGCPVCEASVEQLRTDATFAKLINEGSVKVLAVYPSGERSIWKDYQRKIPTEWTNGFDRNMDILKKELYDLKASPTLYLLDEDKRVLLKDAHVDEILQGIS